MVLDRWSAIFRRSGRQGLPICALIVCVAAQARAQTIVPDAQTCPDCTVLAQSVVRLGAVDGPGALPGAPRDIAVDSRGRYWITFDSATPLVFAADGTFLHAWGASGDSLAGDRSGGALLTVGDSVVVFARERAVVIGPDYEVVREVTMPVAVARAAAVHWPELVTAHAVTASDAGSMHHIDMADGTLLRSFSGRDTTSLVTPLEQQLRELERSLAAPRAGRYWTARAVLYSLEHWNSDGELVQSLRRTPTWLRTAAYGLGGPTRPPAATIRATREDADSMVWIFAAVPAANWQQGWADYSPARDAPADLPSPARLYQTIIEVIDPRGERVVVRRSFDRLIIGTLADDRVAALTVDDDDVTFVTIYTMRLLAPAGAADGAGRGSGRLGPHSDDVAGREQSFRIQFPLDRAHHIDLEP